MRIAIIIALLALMLLLVYSLAAVASRCSREEEQKGITAVINGEMMTFDSEKDLLECLGIAEEQHDGR